MSAQPSNCSENAQISECLAAQSAAQQAEALCLIFRLCTCVIYSGDKAYNAIYAGALFSTERHLFDFFYNCTHHLLLTWFNP